MKPEFSIEFKSGFRDHWAVYEWGVYPRSSVLAGQSRKRFVKSFDSEEAARAAYPDAEVGYRSAHNYYDHLPGEDDPVPGGMYPDDWS